MGPGCLRLFFAQLKSPFLLHSSSRPLLVAKASLASVCGAVELRRTSYAFFELSGDDVCVGYVCITRSVKGWLGKDGAQHTGTALGLGGRIMGRADCG